MKAWAGALENYTFKESKGETQLFVEMDTADEFEDMFLIMFEKLETI